MALRKRAHTQAGILVEKAVSSGISLADLSTQSGVGISTLQRWRATGKGEANLVRKVERLVGSIDFTSEDLATYLARKYERDGKRKAFAVFDSDLYRVVGQQLDANGFLDDVRDKLRLRGYILLQLRKGGRIIHVVISSARIIKIISGDILDLKDSWREITDETMPQDDDEAEIR